METFHLEKEVNLHVAHKRKTSVSRIGRQSYDDDERKSIDAYGYVWMYVAFIF